MKIPLPKPDAALARGGVRRAATRRWCYRLGLKAWAAAGQAAARSITRWCGSGMPVLGALGRAARRVPLAAVGRRLDPASRSRRAAGPHVPGAVGRHQGRGAAMSGGAAEQAAMRSSSRSARRSARYDSAQRRASGRRAPRPRRRRRWCRSAPRSGATSCGRCSAPSSRASRRPSIEAASAAEVPAAVARYLRSTNLPLRVRVGDDAYLDGAAVEERAGAGAQARPRPRATTRWASATRPPPSPRRARWCWRRAPTIR